MDGVKVSLGKSGMTVDASRQWRKIGKSGEHWCICNWMSFTLPFLLAPVFFLIALPCSGGYHLERGGVLLHDAVGRNCKKDTTAENQGAGVEYMGLWAYVGWLSVCYLTLHDYPSFVEGKSMVYYYYIGNVVFIKFVYRIVVAVLSCLNEGIFLQNYWR